MTLGSPLPVVCRRVDDVTADFPPADKVIHQDQQIEAYACLEQMYDYYTPSTTDWYVQ